jgi:predicted amidohydrolase
MQPLDLMLLQFGAGPDPEDNLRQLRRMLAQAPRADVVVLPEVFACRGNRDDYARHAQPVPGPLCAELAGLASARGAWMLAGSLIERADDGALYNTSVLLDPDGRIRARYRKLHLFEARLDDDTLIRESDYYRPGTEPVTADCAGWRCGLSICYDLRFPELYRHYASEGASLLLVPSDFTQRTGRDHWHTLLRARAIENLCYVVAPNQCGTNPRTGVASFGHSLVVDPWGNILAEAGETDAALHARLEPDRLDAARHALPALHHRRL